MKTFLIVLGAIVSTGALLNVAGNGRLGASAQAAARYVTSGYGV